MMVAIPAVTKYIDQAKKYAYVSTAKAYINSVRYSFLNDEYDCTLSGNALGTTYYIPLADYPPENHEATIIDYAEIEQSNGKTPYSKEIDKLNSYVSILINDEGKATYSICINDKGNNGTGSKYIQEEEFNRKDILRNSNEKCSKVGIKCEPSNR